MLEDVSSITDSPRHMALDRRGDCFSRLLLRERLPRSFNMMCSFFLQSDDFGMFLWDGAVAVDGDLHRCPSATASELALTSSAAESCLRKPLLFLGREQLLLRKSFLTRTGGWFETVGNLVSHLIKAVL